MLQEKNIPQEVFDNAEKHIPCGPYCYKLIKIENGDGMVETCPFWDKDNKRDKEVSGYCHYLEIGDWMLDDCCGSFLWDQIKECGINEDDDIDNNSAQK